MSSRWLACAWIVAAGCGGQTATTDATPQNDDRPAGSSLVVQRIPGGWLFADLTAEGSLDWMHWGLNASAGNLGETNRKAGVTHAIGDYVQLGSGALYFTTSRIGPISWTDGTPTVTATMMNFGIYLDTAAPSGAGFELVVQASSEPRRLVLYVGQWCANLELAATLDDGMTPPANDTSWDIPIQRSETGRYVVDFSSPVAGAALHAQIVIANNHCTTGDVGEVWLIAATLATR